MILVYNPTCELAVRHDTLNYQPSRQLMEFERRYAALMMFVSDEGDAVVANRPSDNELQFWSDHGLIVPQFVDAKEARRRISNGEGLKPWGLSREVLYRFGGHALSDSFTSEHRHLFSRLTSVEIDRQLSAMSLPEVFCQDVHPRVVRDESELVSLVGDGQCVLKSLWSASGRGVSIVNRPEFVKPGIARFSTSIHNDGAVVWEPLLQRVIDFALLFEVRTDGSVAYLGRNYYRSDESGRFGVELIGQDPLSEYVESGMLSANWETEAVSYLSRAMGNVISPSLYTGPVGVDSMLYRTADGQMRIRLCIEANVRHTMGNVNMRISKCFEGQKLEWTLGDEMLIKIC